MRDSTHNVEVDELSAKAKQLRKSARIHFQDPLQFLRTLSSLGRITVCCGEDSSLVDENVIVGNFVGKECCG